MKLQKPTRYMKQNHVWILIHLTLFGLLMAFVSSGAARDAWERKANMPTPRWALAPSAVNGKIYAIGGGPEEAFSSGIVEAYHPRTNTWSSKANMPTPRSRLATCVFDGEIYAFGGNQEDKVPVASVEVYNPAKDTWAKKSAMPIPMAGMSTSAVNGKIYVMGGFDSEKREVYVGTQN